MKTNELLQKTDRWLPGDGERHLWAGLEERVAKGHKLLGTIDMFINLIVEIFHTCEYTYVKLYQIIYFRNVNETLIKVFKTKPKKNT